MEADLTFFTYYCLDMVSVVFIGLLLLIFIVRITFNLIFNTKIKLE